MGVYGNGRNFGFGRSMPRAGYLALKERFNHGHYRTVATMARKWRVFCKSCRKNGINDAREITLETIIEYGASLRTAVNDEVHTASYAQNLISSINGTLSALRGDRELVVSPAELVGNRCRVRHIAPYGGDLRLVENAADDLARRGHEMARIVALLARHLGLRLKEALLLDCTEALTEARASGSCTIRRGDKGARSKFMPREVRCTEVELAVLEQASAYQGERRNIIPVDKNLAQAINHVHKVGLPALKRNGLLHFHDLRAAFACDIYKAVTGHPAPVVVGSRRADKALDKEARRIISQALGHSRIQIAAAYVGGSR